MSRLHDRIARFANIYANIAITRDFSRVHTRLIADGIRLDFCDDIRMVFRCGDEGSELVEIRDFRTGDVLSDNLPPVPDEVAKFASDVYQQNVRFLKQRI